MASRRAKAPAPRVSLRETLIDAGLEPRLADLLDQMPHRVVQVEPPLVEYSRRKKSPEASPPVSRWPWKYQTDSVEAWLTLQVGEPRMQLPPSTSLTPALLLVAVNTDRIPAWEPLGCVMTPPSEACVGLART